MPALLNNIFPRYILQLIACPPGIMFLSIPFRAMVSSQHQPMEFAGFEALVILLVGVLAGLLMARLEPSFVSTGRWVWVLPALLIASDLARLQMNPRGIPWLSEAWFASEGEGLGVFLVTLPACAIIGYSIGMALSEVFSRWAKAGPMGLALRVLILFLVAAALVSYSAFALRNYEQQSLARWARVRSVIDRPGLEFSLDAKSLCGDQTTADLSLLPTGMYVESLERKGCR
jgi:hypothetical protein